MISPTDPVSAATFDRPIPRACRRGGFTLVEVLLVVTILLILSAVAVPALSKSVRGNRLRVAASTIVQAGRYARSMAILTQQEMLLTFDLDSATVRVNPLRSVPGAVPPDSDAGTAPASPQPSDVGQIMADTNAPAVPVSSPSLNLTRLLDAVTIESVTLDRVTADTGRSVSVLYRSNGRCTPYKVRIVDEKGSAMVATVDALSSAEVSRENR